MTSRSTSTTRRSNARRPCCWPPRRSAARCSAASTTARSRRFGVSVACWGCRSRSPTTSLPRVPAQQPTSGRLDPALAKPVLDDADYADVVRIVRDSSGIDESYAYAKTFGDKARAELEVFPPSAYRDALESLIYYVVGRRS